MPFLVVTGTFHLVGRTPSGNPSGFEPDGDSVQFRPTDQSLLDRVTRVGSPYRPTSIGSTQLRFEGIDALELHFDGSHQPRPLADRARAVSLESRIEVCQLGEQPVSGCSLSQAIAVLSLAIYGLLYLVYIYGS